MTIDQTSQWQVSKSLRQGLLGLLLVLGFISFVNSARDAWNYGGVDLRDRIVGSRALFAALDPYQFDWQPGMSDWLLNPQRRSPGLTRTCIPPTALLLYGSISWMPYPMIRWFVFCVEWVSLAACILILLRSLPARDDKYLFATLALFFFVCAPFWRLHVERGQYYIYLTLLLSVGVWLELASDRTPPPGWSGIAFGLAMALRPTFLAMLPVLWILRRKPTAIVASTVALTLVSVTLVGFGAGVWSSYFAAMNEHAQARNDQDYEFHTYGTSQSLPEVAEGVHLGRMIDGHTEDVTVSNLLAYASPLLDSELFRYSMIVSKSTALLIISTVMLTVFRARHDIGIRSGLALAVATILNLDFCAPLRFGYSDVMYLPLLALIIPLLRSSRSSPLFVGAILLAFTCGHVGRSLNPVLSGASGTVLRSCLFMGAATVALLFRGPRQILDAASESPPIAESHRLAA